MRLMMIRMLSSNSLTAFSSSLVQGGISPSPIGGPSAISRVRATGLQGQPSMPPAPKLLGPEGASGPPPSRALPRGSLLDLSV